MAYLMLLHLLYCRIVDASYSMLLGRPWVKDARIGHDWGNNIMTIKGNDTIRSIVVQARGNRGETTISVVMLQLSKWYHR